MVRTVAQAVGRQPLTEQDRARPQANTFVKHKVTLGHVISKYFGFLLPVTLHRPSTLIRPSLTLHDHSNVQRVK